MSDVEEKMFVIVQFDEVIDGKKIVELVHDFWLTEDETLCYWPPKSMEYKVPQLVEQKMKPGKTWEAFPVVILARASK